MEQRVRKTVYFHAAPLRQSRVLVLRRSKGKRCAFALALRTPLCACASSPLSNTIRSLGLRAHVQWKTRNANVNVECLLSLVSAKLKFTNVGIVPEASCAFSFTLWADVLVQEYFICSPVCELASTSAYHQETCNKDPVSVACMPLFVRILFTLPLLLAQLSLRLDQRLSYNVNRVSFLYL